MIGGRFGLAGRFSAGQGDLRAVQCRTCRHGWKHQPTRGDQSRLRTGRFYLTMETTVRHTGLSAEIERTVAAGSPGRKVFHGRRLRAPSAIRFRRIARLRTSRCVGRGMPPGRRVREGGLRDFPAANYAGCGSNPVISRLRTRRCMGRRTRSGRRVHEGGLCAVVAANLFAPAGGRHVTGSDSQWASFAPVGGRQDIRPRDPSFRPRPHRCCA
jgi:hypothetical protein